MQFLLTIEIFKRTAKRRSINYAFVIIKISVVRKPNCERRSLHDSRRMFCAIKELCNIANRGSNCRLFYMPKHYT